MNRAVAAAACLLLAALTAACSNAATPAAAPATSAAPTSEQPVAAPTDAPSTSECAQFADVYNRQVGPALKATGGTNVAWTKRADAFHALIAVLAVGADPYSQTLDQDAAAVETSDRAYDTDGNGYGLLATFNTDLDPFLKACGMNGNS